MKILKVFVDIPILIAVSSACGFLTLISARTSVAGLKLFAAALTAITILFIYSQGAFCSSVFIVTLSNGNVIEANSYSIEKDKVRLEYPVGEVSFPRNKVLSIKEKDGNVELLQAAGVYVAQTVPKQPPKAVIQTAALSDRRPSMPGRPGPAGPANPNMKDNAMQDAHAGAGQEPNTPSVQRPAIASTQQPTKLDAAALSIGGNRERAAKQCYRAVSGHG